MSTDPNSRNPRSYQDSRRRDESRNNEYTRYSGNSRRYVSSAQHNQSGHSRNRRRKKSLIRKIKRMWRKKDSRGTLLLVASIIVAAIICIIIVISLASTDKANDSTTKAVSETTAETISTVLETGEVTTVTTAEATTEYVIPSNEVIFTRDEITISDEEIVPSYDTNWHICVNLPFNIVTIYQVDESGNETPVKAMICSVGKPGDETTQGEFYLGELITNWCYMADGTYGQYSYRIIDGDRNALMFHAIPYYDTDRSSLVYEEFNLLGTSQSMGCVRLMMQDAIWLATHVGPNTPVSIYYDENFEEPLPRPEGYFIPPKVEEIRGWDPTDPLSSNPWHYYEYSYDIPDSITVSKDATEDDIYYTILANVTAVDKYGYDVAEYTTYSGTVDTSTPGYYPVSTYLKLGPITAQKDITVVVK